MEYAVERTKDDKLIFKIKTKDKWIYLGSKYNKQREIDKILKEVNEKQEIFYIIIGLDFGYHVEQILKTSMKGKVLILECDENLYDIAIKNRDLSKLLGHKNLKINIFKDRDDIKRALNPFLEFAAKNSLKVLMFSNYKDIYGDKITLALDEIKKFQIEAIRSMNTSKLYSTLFVENCIRNLPLIIKSQRINEYKMILKGQTTAIISAGPSLEKSIPYIKKYRDKLIIITGQRSVGILLNNGIRPDIICIVDSNNVAYEQIKDYHLDNIPIVVNELANYNISQNYNNTVYFISMFKELIKYVTNKSYDELTHGGSVAHLCISTAVYLGSKRVILFGQDSAYTDNKLHADSTANGESNDNLENTLTDKFYVEGNYEEKVLTSYELYDYKNWIENFIVFNKKVEFINCINAGAKIQGAKLIKLEDISNLLDTDALESKKLIEDTLIKRLKNNSENLNANLAHLLNEVTMINELSQKALRLIDLQFANEFNLIKDKIEKSKAKVLYDFYSYNEYEDIINSNEEYIQENDVDKRNKLIYTIYTKKFDAISSLIKSVMK